MPTTPTSVSLTQTQRWINESQLVPVPQSAPKAAPVPASLSFPTSDIAPLSPAPTGKKWDGQRSIDKPHEQTAVVPGPVLEVAAGGGGEATLHHGWWGKTVKVKAHPKD